MSQGRDRARTVKEKKEITPAQDPGEGNALQSPELPLWSKASCKSLRFRPVRAPLCHVVFQPSWPLPPQRNIFCDSGWPWRSFLTVSLAGEKSARGGSFETIKSQRCVFPTEGPAWQKKLSISPGNLRKRKHNSNFDD